MALPLLAAGALARGQARAWEGAITIPTYAWTDDPNPRFWALHGLAQSESPPLTALIYPYTMQDGLTRDKADRTYKALFLENEYLKVVCLPELGGRLHSVLDKTTGQDMFHLNRVIKPSMIGMRGAWISGGVEWNAGPQGHTVTCVSPVNALVGQNADGAAFLEVANLEQTLRTRWTVRLTLHPGRAYLDERIRLFNPTDALSPYYFWNCTAFPCRAGTRFIFPMSLGTDHAAAKFSSWPTHEGKDLSWLRNYETWASIFAVRCEYDFFGAYDVDADRGLVQAADRHKLSGKKAWTWGNWDFGLVSEKNLTDDDGPYIEVQSGPLPTQSDYEALWPRQEVTWQEWWYPVHGLHDGFEYATKDVAIQTARSPGQLAVRVIATGVFPAAACTITSEGSTLAEQTLDLSPTAPQQVTITPPPTKPINVAIRSKTGDVLAWFKSPLPIPAVAAPVPPSFLTAPEEELTAEERYLRGRKFDLATNRLKARELYERALAADPDFVAARRALAILDLEAGLYDSARAHLERATARDGADGLSWYFLGIACHALGKPDEAWRCADQAARCVGTAALGRDLAGRVYLRRGSPAQAREAFLDATEANPRDERAREHLLLARVALREESVWEDAQREVLQTPTNLVFRAVLALRSPEDLAHFSHDVRGFAGELNFEVLEAGLVLADLGLTREACRLVREVCVDALPPNDRAPLPLYYLAYWTSLSGDRSAAEQWLSQAAALRSEYVYPSRPEEMAILSYAVENAPDDARARLYLGNLCAHLGRLHEAIIYWQQAADLDGTLASAFRNLGLYSRIIENDLPKAAGQYVKAIAARPTDQTLYRDLAEILIAGDQRPEAIRLLESIPRQTARRGDVVILLATAYCDEGRMTDAINLLESTPYFVAWEGQGTTWELFHRAHVARGQERLAAGDPAGALQDLEAALTYPANLGVGRSNRPEHALAQYWRGQALRALGRTDQARSAWQEGAAGCEGTAQQNKYRQLCAVELLLMR